jgi:hypothetical protein
MDMRAVTGLVLAALGASAFAGADDHLTLADLSRSDRVRLRLSSGGKRVRGTIDAAGPDEIVVRPKDPAAAPLRLSPPQMAKLEVVRGRRSRWGVGAVIGFLPGALMGAAVAANRECDPECDHTGAALGYGLVGGAITGAVGALIGLAVKTDRWVPVEVLRPKVALSLAPAKGGLGAELSLRF